MRALQEMLRMEELLAEAEFLEKRQPKFMIVHGIETKNGIKKETKHVIYHWKAYFSES